MSALLKIAKINRLIGGHMFPRFAAARFDHDPRAPAGAVVDPGHHVEHECPVWIAIKAGAVRSAEDR
jgi:hypothetical protein